MRASTASATTTRASAIRVGGMRRSNAILAMTAESPQHPPATTTRSAAVAVAPRLGVAMRASALLAVEDALHRSARPVRDGHVVLEEAVTGALLVAETPA